MWKNHSNGELNHEKMWKDAIKALKGHSVLIQSSSHPNSNCTQPISKMIVVTQYDLLNWVLVCVVYIQSTSC